MNHQDIINDKDNQAGKTRYDGTYEIKIPEEYVLELGWKMGICSKNICY